MIKEFLGKRKREDSEIGEGNRASKKRKLKSFFDDDDSDTDSITSKDSENSTVENLNNEIINNLTLEELLKLDIDENPIVYPHKHDVLKNDEQNKSVESNKDSKIENSPTSQSDIFLSLVSPDLDEPFPIPDCDVPDISSNTEIFCSPGNLFDMKEIEKLFNFDKEFMFFTPKKQEKSPQKVAKENQDLENNIKISNKNSDPKPVVENRIPLTQINNNVSKSIPSSIRETKNFLQFSDDPVEGVVTTCWNDVLVAATYFKGNDVVVPLGMGSIGKFFPHLQPNQQETMQSCSNKPKDNNKYQK